MSLSDSWVVLRILGLFLLIGGMACFFVSWTWGWYGDLHWILFATGFVLMISGVLVGVQARRLRIKMLGQPLSGETVTIVHQYPNGAQAYQVGAQPYQQPYPVGTPYYQPSPYPNYQIPQGYPQSLSLIHI
eukprot:TRINITY_DN579_c0_g1_i2.p1 TRINITY_DN579_c0_g1~~TRINITY_DN579_c0_g1_i2.p1  ORF type:complete len:150 (-),score=20.29 TRINITY_DN579_c0_g1_i2:23-415(-)